MKVVSFCTRHYKGEMDRLASSVVRLGLDHDFYLLPDRGSWEANCRQKVPFIIAMRIQYPNSPLLWVDADGELLRVPPVDPHTESCDIGVHFHAREDGYPSPGTVFVGTSVRAYEFLHRWNETDGDTDQDTMGRALRASPSLKLWEMDVRWCRIFDTDDTDDVEDHIIQHHQASRRLRLRGPSPLG